MPSRIVDEYASHHPRGDSEELSSAGPIRILLSEPQVRFMDERRRRKRVPRWLGTQLIVGNTAKLRVDERNQPLQAVRRTASQHGQGSGDLVRG